MSTFSAILDNVLGPRAIQKAFDKNYSVGTIANDWVLSNGSRLQSFNGTKAALDQRITDMCNDCAAYVHDKNWQISTKTAVSECRNQIENKYSTLIANYTGAQAKEEATLKSVALEKNSKLIALVAIILAVLITTVIILRIKNK